MKALDVTNTMTLISNYFSSLLTPSPPSHASPLPQKAMRSEDVNEQELRELRNLFSEVQMDNKTTSAKLKAEKEKGDSNSEGFAFFVFF